MLYFLYTFLVLQKCNPAFLSRFQLFTLDSTAKRKTIGFSVAATVAPAAEKAHGHHAVNHLRSRSFCRLATAHRGNRRANGYRFFAPTGTRPNRHTKRCAIVRTHLSAHTHPRRCAGGESRGVHRRHKEMMRVDCYRPTIPTSSAAAR